MVRLIDNKLEGQIPSSLSSYNIKKRVIKEKFELARKRYECYLETICSHFEGKTRLNNTSITKYSMEEFILSKINHWDLDNKGTIIGHNIRLFEMEKSDIHLIPYKEGSPMSIFVSKDWIDNRDKSISLMLKLADACILDIISDDIPIGQWDSIWIHKGFELDFTVFIIIVDYYITLFRCIISSASKLSYYDFIESISEEYSSPFSKEFDLRIWNYASKVESNTDTDSDYNNLMISMEMLKMM